MGPSHVDELGEATGLSITWASVAMDRASDWTPSTVTVYLLWLTPAIVSLAVPLGCVLLRACRPKDATVGEVLAALHRVEAAEVLPRWTEWVEARANWVHGLAICGVIGGVAILPWLPGQLMLYWLLPLATEGSGGLTAWMLHDAQNKLRRVLYLSLPACVAYGT
jgi:hypothetical protein